MTSGGTSFLKSLQTSVKNKPSAILIYSMPGGGKTSFGAEFPDCIFGIDDKEDGINDLKKGGTVREDIPVAPPFKCWQDVLDLTDELITQEHGFKWFILDSASGIERLLHKHVADIKYSGDMTNTGFMSFKKGYDDAIPYLDEWILKLDQLREKGVGIVLLAHSKIAKFNDPINGGYDRVNVDVHEKMYSALAKYMTIIGYIEMVASVQHEKGKKDIAKGGNIRVLHLNHNAVFDAKNRSGINHPIDMGNSSKESFANFFGALKQAKLNAVANQQSTTTESAS